MKKLKTLGLAMMLVGVMGAVAQAGTTIWGSTHRSVATTNRIPVDTGSSSGPGYNSVSDVLDAMSGDCTSNAASVTCTKTNGSAFTALATTAPGTGVATALGVNVGSAGAFITYNGAAGTPSALVGTNITGTATGLTAGTATALATARAIYGNNFDGSAALTQVIASTYGGTGNGFAKFSGPTTAEKTFILPDASATLLYSGGDAGTPSALVGTNISGTAASLTAGAATTATTATTATNATNSAITNDTTTNATMFPTWVTANTGNLPVKTASTKLTFNPSTGMLSSTGFTGALTGNASTVTNGVYTTDSGTVTNTMLLHPSTTVNGSVCTLGSTCSPTASANLNAITSVLFDTTNHNLDVGKDTTPAAGAVDNTIVGAGAGNPASATGGTQDNTALGYNVFTALTSGGSNTCMGSNTCSQLTGAANIIAIGVGAYQNGGNAVQGIAIGNGAMQKANPSSAIDENIAIGTSALQGQNPASGNTGTGNIGIGENVLTNMTTSTNNTIIGFFAGSSVTTGAGNTALGYRALQTSTTDGNNTALGYEALYSTTLSGAAAKDTAVGWSAGTSTTACTTCTSSIFLGADAHGSAANTANEIVIGKGAAGLGANQTVIGNSSTTTTTLGGGALVVPTSISYGTTISGPAGRKGTFVCTGGGSITVSNANMAATSNVIISMNAQGGTITTPPAFKSVSASTNFIVLCGTTDTSTYNYIILN